MGILKNLYIQADKRVEEGHKMPIGKKFSPSAVWQWQWCTHQRPPQSASVPGRLHSAQCATVRPAPAPASTIHQSPVTSHQCSGEWCNQIFKQHSHSHQPQQRQTNLREDFTITEKAPTRGTSRHFQSGEGPSRGLLRD